MSNWLVLLSPTFISWVQKQDDIAFEYYVKAVEGIRKIAEAYSQVEIASCGQGFLIEVYNQNTVLMCFI
jgi:hypothetical protein